MDQNSEERAARVRAYNAVVAVVESAAYSKTLPTNEIGVFGEFFVVGGTKLYVTGRLRPAGNVTVANFWAVPD